MDAQSVPLSINRAVRADERAIRRLVVKHQCTAAYLDVGANIGVQIRKLFEPDLYHSALAVSIFRDAFRSHERCRVCAIGVEPNPRHHPRLSELEARYGSQGWPVAILRGAAATYDGEQQFFTPPFVNSSLEVSAHTGFLHPRTVPVAPRGARPQAACCSGGASS